MEIAISRLDDNPYTPSELTPELAELLILACPVCRESVFPVWGKKMRDHYRHYSNADIDCEFYYGGEFTQKEQTWKQSQPKTRPPILQRMLSQRMYSLVFEYTYFPEKGDAAVDHLGNALNTSTKGAKLGVEALERTKDLLGFTMISRNFQEVDFWDIDELTELIRSSFTHETASIVWGFVIERELEQYRILEKEKIEARDLGVAAIARSAINAYENVKQKASPKVLQLIIDFLRQKRQLPILKDLVIMAYLNSTFPKNPETLELARKSGWIQSHPKEMPVSQFFGEIMGLSLVRLLISIPWIGFANQFNKDATVKTIEAIQVPQLLIPGLIVQPLRGQ